jgi:hypothetical protein
VGGPGQSELKHCRSFTFPLVIRMAWNMGHGTGDDDYLCTSCAFADPTVIDGSRLDFGIYSTVQYSTVKSGLFWNSRSGSD